MLQQISNFWGAGRQPALAAMFEARKRVFVDILRWELPVLDGKYEVDQFDTARAVYILLSNSDGSHRASARLLLTTAPHILGDLYPDLCNTAVPRGSDIREITRFCIEPDLPRAQRKAARNELVSALADYAVKARISSYTAVAERKWYRQIETFGWQCETLGPGKKLGGEDLVGLRITIDVSTRDYLAHTGIYRSSAFEVAALDEELAA